MNIAKFEPGDLITRNEPSGPHGGITTDIWGNKSDPHRDRSYIADRLTLVGVESGLIVLRREKGSILDDKPIILPTDLWSEGWAPYPASLIAHASSHPDSQNAN